MCARLDYDRYLGDSLQGCYFYDCLHPLSVAELNLYTQKDLEQLLQLGGFPELFFSASKKQSQRWLKDYQQRLVFEEVRSLEQTQYLSHMQLLPQRLPLLVGSLLSVQSLREDLQVAHKTIVKWLAILERLYFLFRLPPFGMPQIRAIKKAQKGYLYHWNMVPDPAARFENLIAAALLKWVHFKQDTEGEDLELKYFRDRSGREVDFIIEKLGVPLVAIEVKMRSKPVSTSLKYFKSKFPKCRAIQVSYQKKESYLTKEGIEVLSWDQLLHEFC